MKQMYGSPFSPWKEKQIQMVKILIASQNYEITSQMFDIESENLVLWSQICHEYLSILSCITCHLLFSFPDRNGLPYKQEIYFRSSATTNYFTLNAELTVTFSSGHVLYVKNDAIYKEFKSKGNDRAWGGWQEGTYCLPGLWHWSCWGPV